MTLNIIDPAFLFPGISLLFLAYTNRYLTLAGIVRTLNTYVDRGGDADNKQQIANREQQITALHLRIVLIKYMQAFGVLAFLCCVVSMLAILWQSQPIAQAMFVGSLLFLVVSLLLSLVEILNSGQSLKIELERTRISKNTPKSDEMNH